MNTVGSEHCILRRIALQPFHRRLIACAGGADIRVLGDNIKVTRQLAHPAACKVNHQHGAGGETDGTAQRAEGFSRACTHRRDLVNREQIHKHNCNQNKIKLAV